MDYCNSRFVQLFYDIIFLSSVEGYSASSERLQLEGDGAPAPGALRSARARDCQRSAGPWLGSFPNDHHDRPSPSTFTRPYLGAFLLSLCCTWVSFYLCFLTLAPPAIYSVANAIGSSNLGRTSHQRSTRLSAQRSATSPSPCAHIITSLLPSPWT